MLEHVQIRECAGSPNRADIGQRTIESILSRRYSTYTIPGLGFQTQGVADHLRKLDEALTSLIDSVLMHNLHPRNPKRKKSLVTSSMSRPIGSNSKLVSSGGKGG